MSSTDKSKEVKVKVQNSHDGKPLEGVAVCRGDNPEEIRGLTNKNGELTLLSNPEETVQTLQFGKPGYEYVSNRTQHSSSDQPLTVDISPSDGSPGKQGYRPVVSLSTFGLDKVMPEGATAIMLESFSDRITDSVQRSPVGGLPEISLVEDDKEKTPPLANIEISAYPLKNGRFNVTTEFKTTPSEKGFPVIRDVVSREMTKDEIEKQFGTYGFWEDIAKDYGKSTLVSLAGHMSHNDSKPAKGYTHPDEPGRTDTDTARDILLEERAMLGNKQDWQAGLMKTARDVIDDKQGNRRMYFLQPKELTSLEEVCGEENIKSQLSPSIKPAAMEEGVRRPPVPEGKGEGRLR